MFNPLPYDDPTAVNRPGLAPDTVDSIVAGTRESAAFFSDLLYKKLSGGNVIAALDGYIGAKWDQVVNLISQNLRMKSVKVRAISFAEIYKSSCQLDELLAEHLEEDKVKDPVLLFGKLFRGSYEELLDPQKLTELEQLLKEKKTAGKGNEIVLV